jgi:hypothetical protein
MLILESILQYSFIFSIKIFVLKKKNPNISALYFWNYFMPNLLPGYGSQLDLEVISKSAKEMKRFSIIS